MMVVVVDDNDDDYDIVFVTFPLSIQVRFVKVKRAATSVVVSFYYS